MRGSRAFTAGRGFHPALKGALYLQEDSTARTHRYIHLAATKVKNVDEAKPRQPELDGPQGRCKQTERREA